MDEIKGLLENIEELKRAPISTLKDMVTLQGFEIPSRPTKDKLISLIVGPEPIIKFQPQPQSRERRQLLERLPLCRRRAQPTRLARRLQPHPHLRRLDQHTAQPALANHSGH